MKILMFGWEFPPYNAGGLGVACLGLSRALAREGTSVSFVLPKRVPVTSLWVDFVFAGVEDATNAYKNGAMSPYRSIKDGAWSDEEAWSGGMWSLMQEVLEYAQKAKLIAQQIPHDVIHVHDWLSIPAGISAHRASGAPLFVHIHATEFDRTGGTGINEEVYRIERMGVHEADHVFAVSEYTKNILVRHYGADPTKITVLYNGLDEEDVDRSAPSSLLWMQKQRGKSIVAFIGRITIQKGPDYFIRVAKLVLSKNPDVFFVVAGSGDMEKQIIMHAAYEGIADKVLFAGFARGSELASVFKSADIVVMPSVSEPFGIVPLEAMAHGATVIISKQSGVAEILRNVFVSDFWDIARMADQILSLLKHRSLRNMLSEDGKKEIRQHSWQTRAKTCVSTYWRVLQLLKQL
jgi:glycosyltransferase involved in cell wall biosynthesis